MKDRLRVLCVALERGNYELAAHALVYGMVKARIERKDKENQRYKTKNSRVAS